MSRILKAGTYLIVVGILGFVAWLIIDNNAEQTKVLIVHSYNTDMTWVNDIDEGINRVLESDAVDEVRNLVVRRHYMGLLGQDNCFIFKNAASDVRFTIDDWKPKVIIIVDDIGQSLVGFNQLAFEPGAEAERDAMAQRITANISGKCEGAKPDFFGLNNPVQYDGAPMQIIFAGVNGGVEKYGYDRATNVSGIFEHKNYASLVETLQTLESAYEGDVAGIQMINDASGVAQAENSNYESYNWAPFESHPAVSAGTLAAWQAAVEAANEQDLMLLTANYDNVCCRDGERVDASWLIQWTEANAKLPVLGANTKFVTDGGMITVAISGTEQGAVAMDLALKALAGEPDDNWREAQQYLIGMNHGLFRKRNLDMPSIYRAFSTEIGQFQPEILEQVYVEEKVN